MHSCDQEFLYIILDTRIGVILNLPFKKTGHGSWCYIYDQKGNGIKECKMLRYITLNILFCVAKCWCKDLARTIKEISRWVA